MPIAIIFHLFFLVKLFRSSCATITQGTCNISPLLLSVHSILLFPFEWLMTRSHKYSVWTVHFFGWHSKCNYTFFFCVNITQVLCKGISPLPVSEPSVETVVSLSWKVLFFPFESFMNHSYFHAAWTVTHSFLHYISGHSTWLLLGHFSTYFCSYLTQTGI